MRDFKEDIDTTVDNTVDFINRNKILTGAIAGGATGTFVFPIPVIGTLLGVWVGVKIAEKMIREEKQEKDQD